MKRINKIIVIISNATSVNCEIKRIFLHEKKICIFNRQITFQKINKFINLIEIEFGFGRKKQQLEIYLLGDNQSINYFQKSKYYNITSTFNQRYKITNLLEFEDIHQNRDLLSNKELEDILKQYQIESCFSRLKIKNIYKEINDNDLKKYTKEITLFFGIFIKLNELFTFFEGEKIDLNVNLDFKLTKFFYNRLITNKIKPILLTNWQSIYFYQNLIKGRFQELYKPVYIINKSNFLNQLNKFKKYKYLHHYLNNNINKENNELYYYDINRSYQYILENKLFRTGNLKFIQSNNLEDYNFLINCNIYHDPKIIDNICIKFKLNQIQEIQFLSIENIKLLKTLYPSIYRPYISIEEKKGFEKFYRRPIILKENKINIWLSKEEIDYCLLNNYIIEPIEGVNREKFNSLKDCLNINKDFSNNFFFKKLYKKSIHKLTGLLRKNSIIIQNQKYHLNNIIGVINQNLINNLTIYNRITDENKLLINLTTYKESYSYYPFFKRIFKNKTILMYYEIINSGRIFIHNKIIENLKKGYEVIYSNTDSIITTGKFDSNLLSNKIGNFKEEYKNLDGIYIHRINQYIISREDNLYIKGDDKEFKNFPNKRFRLKRNPIIENNIIIESLPYIYERPRYKNVIFRYSTLLEIMINKENYEYYAINFLKNPFMNNLPINNNYRFNSIKRNNFDILDLNDELINYYFNHNLNNFSQVIKIINNAYYSYKYFHRRIEIDIRLLLYYDFLNNKKIPESGVRKINQIKEWLNKEPLPIQEFIKSQFTGNKININYLFELKLLLNNKIKKNHFFLLYLIYYNYKSISIKKRFNITTNEELINYYNELNKKH